MSAVSRIRTICAEIGLPFGDSNATIEGKIIDAVGTFADTVIAEQENTIKVINFALAHQRTTTVEYYRRKAVAYQQGYDLSYDSVNQGGYYPVIDAAAQVVKQAYIIGEYPSYTLLANVVGSDRRLRKMTPTELSGFVTYFEAFMPLGLELNINSLEVARISDPGIAIYIQAGTDSVETANSINANLLAYESIFRRSNTVSLTEIEDIIQATPGVLAVGWDKPQATEQQIDGSLVTVTPKKGVFTLTNGAFSFVTKIASENIKVLQ